MRESTAPECHIVTHVHWDREWYRPFESYRTRLVELVEQVCRQLESGSLERFHLDGQTITLRDVGDLRPDLVDRIREHVQSGRLTIGPWHVLADNQLVSGENLIRNLLAAKRHGAAAGTLTGIGYSPDAFGHPADLPRILRGFGIDTALVWRGAPEDLAEFRWRSPDGSEVYTVNQAYHQAEVLWTPEGRDERLAEFLEDQSARRPGGPWLVMNGGDHIAPRDTGGILAGLGEQDAAQLVQSSLETFFAEVRAAHPEPAVIDDELRYPGSLGTFLLPGTISSRGYLKQENAAVENLLERTVEPLLAAEILAPGPTRPAAPDDMPIDGPVISHLRHAWELVLENAPHDSICGCSVDEVHRENSVRSERVAELGDQLVRRSLLRCGFDPRVHGAPAFDQTRIAVFVPPAAAGRRVPVTVEITVPPEQTVTALRDATNAEVAVEMEDLGTEMTFEADLDLLPDSVATRRLRLRFLAQGVPAGGIGVYTVVLAAGSGAECASEEVAVGARVDLGNGLSAAVAADGSFTLADEARGIHRPGLARLVDGGDRGDTYNYDAPASDVLIPATASDVRVARSDVRTVLSWTATLDIPAGLTDDRDARTEAVHETPVRIDVVRWHGMPGVEWTASFTNSSLDHRLRAHFPVAHNGAQWKSGQHYSSIDRDFGPVIGELPTERNHEAEIGTHPAHGYAVAGGGGGRVGLVFDHVSEVQGLNAEATAADAELVVTLLRSTGWLSRFDLRSRTTGAGPQLATPEAQTLRPVTARIGIRLGGDDTTEFALADAADQWRAGAVAFQLRAGTSIPAALVAPTMVIENAIVAAVKPADDGDGVIVRVANPTNQARTAAISLPDAAALTPMRLDETAADADVLDREDADGRARYTAPLSAYGLATFRVTAARTTRA